MLLKGDTMIKSTTSRSKTKASKRLKSDALTTIGFCSGILSIISLKKFRYKNVLLTTKLITSALLVHGMSKKKEEEEQKQEIEEEIRRVKLPRGTQVLGLLEQRVGGSRTKVRCLDGKMRICRIPGRLKRKLWVREGDIVLVEPWELSGEGKGDIIFKYKPIQVDFLKRNGYLDKMQDFEEF